MTDGKKMARSLREQNPSQDYRFATAAGTPKITQLHWNGQGARGLTLALKGRWHGRFGTASCPICQPEGRPNQNALTLADGRNGLLAHCKKSHCTFTEIIAAVGILRSKYYAPSQAVIAQRERELKAENDRRAKQAIAIWREARPIAGTPAATYLRGRAIVCSLPDTLRFHPACWHGATSTRHPAMVALVEGGDTFAVHRTYLQTDGSEKAAIKPDKMMLGATSRGAVRLTDGPGELVVCEGIETALSLSCGLLRASGTIWAALSASGMRALRLPYEPRHLTIATDGDRAGREAGRALEKRALTLGWKVSLLPAPEGRDWNDVLVMKGDKE